MKDQEKCVESYSRIKNLKLVGIELGIPWQTVYVHLQRAGVSVAGDKLRYGSDTDRLAAAGEQLFRKLVPNEDNKNMEQFQAKVDFEVRGHLVDVKTSTLRSSNKACKKKRWAFCIKKQERIADFLVCFGLGNSHDLVATLLIPCEISRRYTTIGLGEALSGKWADYLIDPSDLCEFFCSIPQKQKAA